MNTWFLIVPNGTMYNIIDLEKQKDRNALMRAFLNKLDIQLCFSVFLTGFRPKILLLIKPFRVLAFSTQKVWWYHWVLSKPCSFLSAMSLPRTSKDLNSCPSSALPQNLDKNINSFNIQITYLTLTI